MFKSKKKQVIKMENEDNKLLYQKKSDIITDRDAIIEVPPTHNAFVVKGGGDMRFYKSGNLPAFDNKDEVKKWKQGLSVDVIYVPENTDVEVFWGTPDKATYRDTISGKVVSVGLRGKAMLYISNHMKFLQKVVGAKREFCVADFQSMFRDHINNQVVDVFLNVVEEQHLTYDQFDAKKLSIGEKIGEKLGKKFDERWGVALQEFIISGCMVDEADKAKVEQVAEDLRREQEEAKREAKLKEAMAELERLNDKQWEREKYLRQLEREDNIAYYEVLKAIGSKDFGGRGANFCPRCGHSCETTAEFCPNCGNRLGKTSTVCPECGKVHADDATFCSGCGKKLR